MTEIADKLSIRYALACLAWAVLTVWPDPLPRWMFWILPSAGDFAYWKEPAFAEHRRSGANWRRDHD